MNIKWILQRNLTNSDILQKLKDAIVFDNAQYEDITVVPFSEELDYKLTEEVQPVVYGSTTLMLTAYKNKDLKNGVFYDESRFNMKNYIDKWNKQILNSDGELLKIKEFVNRDISNEEMFFIRPNEDNKSFSGMVTNFYEFKSMVKNVGSDNPYINPDTLILTSRPKQIEKEWRNFIVAGKVVSCARYCQNGKVNISTEDSPIEMIEFVQKCCREYMPHDIFVMDVGLYQGNYYIIECNCFN